MRRHRAGHPDGRTIHAVADRLGGAPFFVTYGDGLADLDLGALAAAHAAAGALATMTVVRPRLPFGVAVLGAGDRVTGFQEKPAPTSGSTAASSCSSPACWP